MAKATASAQELQIGPFWLLFFIDETGHEDFADPKYPVFGLGGCAVMSSGADISVNDAWRSMKAEFFGGANIPLHANELDNPTPQQLAALSRFFTDQKFARFALPPRPRFNAACPPSPAAGTPNGQIAGTFITVMTDVVQMSDRA